MSWIRSSKGITLLAVLVVAFGAAGVVTAASVSADAPAEAQVGDEITVSATISDVYETSEEWRLNGTTELRNVTGWEVTKVTPSGDENTTRFGGSTTFEVPITGAENLDHVEVSITGDVPPIEAFSYDPPQTFAAADFNRVEGNNENDIETIAVHHFTEESKQTREVIDEASAAVEDGDSEDARQTLENAIGVFDGESDENFGEARSLAEDAQSTADSAQQSAQTMQLVLYGVGALVVIALLGGGIYYWRSQQDDYDKLR